MNSFSLKIQNFNVSVRRDSITRRHTKSTYGATELGKEYNQPIDLPARTISSQPFHCKMASQFSTIPITAH